MIPKMTQEAPNIVPRYWCERCGENLQAESTYTNTPSWNFCPKCGEAIDWDKVVPVKWAPIACSICGTQMIQESDGIMVSTGEYVGTDICRSCMAEYCLATNCLGCERGTFPNCRWYYIKRSAKRARKFAEEAMDKIKE